MPEKGREFPLRGPYFIERIGWSASYVVKRSSSRRKFGLESPATFASNRRNHASSRDFLCPDVPRELGLEPRPLCGRPAQNIRACRKAPRRALGKNGQQSGDC